MWVILSSVRTFHTRLVDKRTKVGKGVRTWSRSLQKNSPVDHTVRIQHSTGAFGGRRPAGDFQRDVFSRQRQFNTAYILYQTPKDGWKLKPFMLAS